MLQVFLRLTDGQVPRQDWTARLTEVSEPFRHMGEQAEVWMPSGLRIAPRR
jgi:hypothetical protein